MSALVAADHPSRSGIDAAAAPAPRTLTRLRTFHTLDALRGVAALTVVLFHTAFFYGIVPPAEGQIAVDLFFVMSGFIIAHRYEHDFFGGMSVARFVKIRLVRLYPLFILGAALGAGPALLALMGGDDDAFHRGLIESFPLAIVMLPSRYAMPRIDELYPLNYVAWSLVLEIIINIAYAATFRAWTARRLVLVLGGAFIGLCIAAAVCGSLKYGYAWAQAWVGPIRVVYGFGAGVLIYRVFGDRPATFRSPWWGLLIAALALFWFDPGSWKPVWEVVAVTVLVPAIVVATIANEPPQALRGICALAGVFSYVVYSLHAPFVGLFLRGEERLHFDLQTTSPMRALVFTLLLAALCIVAHTLYDRPVRAWLTRRFTQQLPSTPSAILRREKF